MLRRIRNQQHGLKEREAMQLVHAFVVSRVMYGPPHLNLTKKEVEKLDVLLRKAYKNALGLQEYAATKRLLQLGVHNTFEELANAQIGAQIRRLGGTDSGRWVLYKLELAKPNAAFLQQQIKLDDYIRAGVRTSRISRNMNPSRDAERRMARSEALARTWDSRPGTLYVDAAGPVSGVATAAVATSDGRKIVTKASFRVSCATEAEEVAIALAITCNPKATIISDSQGAVRNFTAGSVGEVAAGLLRRHPPQCGLVVDPAGPWLGTSPDRLVWDPEEVNSHGILKVKCPYSVKDTATPPTADGSYLVKNDSVVCSHVDVFINETKDNCLLADLYQFLDIQLYPLNPPFDRPRNVLTSLWGATCNPTDRLEERTLMFNVSVDEWLFMDNMGAYSLAGVTGFNGFGFPFVKYITTADKRPSVQRIVDSMVMRGGYGQVEEAIMARHPSGRITVADAGAEEKGLEA
ncbi:hypothetical protein ISCGN_002405 [Ixodes scapularis]